MARYNTSAAERLPAERKTETGTLIDMTRRTENAEKGGSHVRTDDGEMQLRADALDARLKKTGLNGYTRSSVEAYVEELNRSADQLRDSLEQQIESLSGECVRLRSEGSLLRNQIIQMEEQFRQTRDRLEQTEKERDEAEKRIGDSDTQLNDLETVLNCYEAEKAKAEELEEVIAELRARSAEYEEGQNEAFRLMEEEEKRAARAEEEIRTFMENSEALRLEADSLTAALSEEKAKLKKAEKNAAELSAALNEEQTKLWDAERSAAELSEALRGEQAKLRAAEENAAELSDALNEERSKLRESEKNAAELSDTLTEKQTKLWDAEQNAIDLTAALTGEREKLRDAEQRAAELTAALTGEKERRAALEDRVSAMEAELAAARAELREAGECVEKAKTELAQHADRNAALNDRIDELEEELREERERPQSAETIFPGRSAGTDKDTVTQSLYFQMEQRRQKETRKDGRYTESSTASERVGAYSTVRRRSTGAGEQMESVTELQNVVQVLLDEMQKQMDYQDEISNECRENRELISALSRDRSSLLNQNEELLDRAEEMERRIAELEEENAGLAVRGRRYDGGYVSTLPPALVSGPSDLEERFSETMRRLRQRNGQN